MQIGRRGGLAVLGLLPVLLATTPSPAEPTRGGRGGSGASDAELREVLSGFDRVQDSIRTLSAEFTETTENQLLREPLQAKGRFFLTKPDRVMWEYTTPEVMRFVIADNEYIGYFPERKRAEKRDVHRWSEQIFRFFGLGQGSAELGKFYDIRLEGSSPDAKGNYLLLLRPKKRRVRKHVEEVQFWVSAATFLPVKISYSGKDGYTRLVQFRDVAVNPDLSASLYQVEIPPGVTVTNGFSGLGAISPGSAGSGGR